MIFDTSDDAAPQMTDYNCSHCSKAFPIPCGIRVNTPELSDSLLNGTLLNTLCPHCGTVSYTDNFVQFEMSDWGIGEFLYLPLHALLSDDVCEYLIEDGTYQMTFYSIEELVNQVRARTRLAEYLITEFEDHPKYIPYLWPHFA